MSEDEVIIEIEREAHKGDGATKPRDDKGSKVSMQGQQSELDKVMREFEQARQAMESPQQPEIARGDSSSALSEDYAMPRAVEQRLRALGVFDVLQTKESELEEKAEELEAEPVKRDQPNGNPDSNRVNYVVCSNEQSCAIGGQRIALREGAEYCANCGSKTKILAPAPDDVVVVREVLREARAIKAPAQAKKNGVKFVEDPRRAIFRVARENGYFVGSWSFIANTPEDLPGGYKTKSNSALVFRQQEDEEFARIAKISFRTVYNGEETDYYANGEVVVYSEDAVDDMTKIAKQIGEEKNQTLEVYLNEEPYPFSLFPPRASADIRNSSEKITLRTFKDFRRGLKRAGIESEQRTVFEWDTPHEPIYFFVPNSSSEFIKKGLFGREKRFSQTSYVLGGFLVYQTDNYGDILSYFGKRMRIGRYINPHSNWELWAYGRESREILLPPVLELARRHGITLGVVEAERQSEIVKVKRRKVGG
ncbi:hypothetical protein D6817_01150 [Candidatus Pacearchaeota archaeon]|nr:MAG: hypothetical protein D6817_01150 [Candidatus Pacearchaeota archaeon]